MRHYRELNIIYDNHLKFLKVNVFIHYIGIDLYILEVNQINYSPKNI
jgi:hypothetical protein